MPSAVYIQMAQNYQWSQAQVDESDAQVIDHHLIYLRAAADHEKRERKLDEMKQRLKNKGSKR